MKLQFRTSFMITEIMCLSGSRLAGEATMLCNIVGCCEIDKHNFNLIFCQEAVFDLELER